MWIVTDKIYVFEKYSLKIGYLYSFFQIINLSLKNYYFFLYINLNELISWDKF